MQQVHPIIAQASALLQAGRDAEALLVINQLAGRGDAEGLFVLGDFHWRGWLVPQDMARGRALFERAADAGHPIAMRACTNLLASGIGGACDWTGAVERLRSEAREDPRRGKMLALIARMDLTPTGDPRSLPEPERLSDSPEVTLFPGLFSKAECDFLRLVAEPTYEPSMILVDGREVPDPVRTSDGAPIHWLIEDPVIHALNRRLAAASGTGFDQGEPLMILRYRPGQQYRPHLDALPGVENPRIKTALVYLGQDYAGGETLFVKTGLKVRGRSGDAIVFRNTDEEGRPDTMSEHAGLAVTSGTKYLASRWIRERRHLP